MQRVDDDDDDAFDERGLLRDAKRWRVPLRMMDSLQRAQLGIRTVDGVGHRPGFVADARAASDRQAAYDEYERSLRDAWKNPQAGEDCKVKDRQPSRSQDSTLDARQAAYAEYAACIAQAWRGSDQ